MGRSKATGITVVILGVSIASLLVPLPNLNRSIWLTKLLDLGHVPLFAVVTICLWWIAGRRVWLAFGLASLLAVVMEIAQLFIDRSGEAMDALRGVLGALIGVLVLQMASRSLQWRPIAIRLALAMVLVAWPIWDCGPVLIDAIWSYRSFPVLSDFTSPWEAQRWYLDAAHLNREVTAEPGHQMVGRLDLFAREGGSGAILFPMIQDWSRYRRLYCTFSFTGDPLRILISVRDGKKVAPPLRRFDLVREFDPGQHCVEIDLQDLAAGTQFAPLDLSRIQSFHIVATNLSGSRTLFLHKIYLE